MSLYDFFKRLFRKENETNDRKIKQIKQIETYRKKGQTVPFEIVELKNNGFIALINGLNAYISFQYMPWRYFKKSTWTRVAPHLIGRQFQCKIATCNTDDFSVTLNGSVSQFKKPKLEIGSIYKGIITQKANYGFFIDIGYYFNWKFGSIVGLLHQSEFGQEELKLNEGDVIEVMYHGNNRQNKVMLKNKTSEVDQYSLKMNALVGKSTWAAVVRNEDKKKTNKLLIEGKYKAFMRIPDNQFPPEYRESIHKAFRNLSHNEVVQCEIVNYFDKSKTFTVNLIAEFDQGKLLNVGLPEYHIDRMNENVSQTVVINNDAK